MYSVKVKSDTLSVFDKNNTNIFSIKTIDKDIVFDSYGIYGTIIFEGTEAMVFITKASRVGNLHNNDVFMAESAKVIILKSEKSTSLVKNLKRSIEYFFNKPGIYFSNSDLYFPQAFDKKNISKKKAYLSTAESYDKDSISYSFLFNLLPLKNTISRLSSINFESPILLKSIQGYFSQYNDLYLISRRCPKYTGMRYFARGVNKDGYPSNFVETEQFIAEKSSYLQVRGSIPLPWSHELTTEYRPKIKVISNYVSSLCKRSHKILMDLYERPIIYLNLISDKGYESVLNEKFNENYKFLTKFYNFNFSKDIRKKPFPIDFKATGINTETRDQTAIIRTNCIDCLDRTNSMQFIIAREALQTQLEEQKVEELKIKEYQDKLKKMFYENGNNLSKQYAGTDAMSSYHITGEGKTLLGLITDVKLSLTRYFINRYNQGAYSDLLRIVTGTKTKGQVPIVPNFSLLKLILMFLVPTLLFYISSKIPKKNPLVSIISTVLILALTFKLFVKFDLPKL